LRSQTTNDPPVRMQTTVADTYHNCYVNADGSRKFAVLNQVCYIFDSFGQWVPFGLPNVRNILLHDETTILVTNDVLFFVEPAHPSPSLGTTILWSCFTRDFQHFAVSLFVFVLTQIIRIYNIGTGLVVAEWTLTNSQQIFPTLAFSATCANSFDGHSTLTVFAQDVNRTIPAQKITLDPSLPTASVIMFIMQAPRFYDQYFVTNTGAIQNIVTNNIIVPPAPLNPLSVTTVLAPSPNNNDIWLSVKGDFWRLQNELLWTVNNPNIYLDFAARVNDQYNNSEPAEIWYAGQEQFNFEPPTIPGVFHKSRHNHYRWILDALISVPTTFPFIASHLEQANEYLLLTSNNFVAKVFENANITVQDALTEELIWESNTRDQSSDPTKFHTWISRALPLSTTNGLYLTHLIPTVGVRLAYNVYNSPRFAKFCQQDSEFLARALDQQSDFCFANLNVAVPGAVPFFADSRCACVGGTRLFEETFPALAEQHSQTSGRLVASLPCLLSECGDSFADGPELSNSYLRTDVQCHQDINVCTEIISISQSGTLNLNNLILQQNCGTDPTACLMNDTCPIGSVCIDGTCVMSCTTDEFCKNSLANIAAICTSTGRCEFKSDPAIKQQEQTWFIVTMVCVFLIIVFIILLLAFFVKKKPQE